MLVEVIDIAVSALLLSLSMPGYLYGGFVFVALVGLFLALDRKGPILSALYSFLFFFLFTLTNFHFLIDVLTNQMPALFGKFSAVAGIGVFILFGLWEALPFLLFGFLYGLWHDRVRYRVLQPLFAASLYVVAEYLRGIGDLGFTGGRLSEALYDFRGIIQILSLTGTLGLTFLIVVVNYEIYRLLKASKYNVVVAFAVAGLLPFVDGAIENFVPKEMGSLPILVAQTDVPQDIKYSPEKERVLAYLIKSFRNSPNFLTILPEATFPDTDIRGTELERRLTGAFSDRTLVVGFPTRDGENFYNSLGIYRNGEYVGKYDKVRLFPFVEFLPYPQVFGFLKFLQGFATFTPGAFGTYEIDGYGRVGFQICFESYFPYVSRRLAESSDFLVVATNDGWYRSKIALAQHFAQCVLRAVEVRRDFVQVSNTGLSGVADAFGNYTLLPYGTNFKIVYVSARNDETIYAKFGDYFALVSIVLVLFCGLTIRQKKTIFD